MIHVLSVIHLLNPFVSIDKNYVTPRDFFSRSARRFIPPVCVNRPAPPSCLSQSVNAAVACRVKLTEQQFVETFTRKLQMVPSPSARTWQVVNRKFHFLTAPYARKNQ